MTTYYHGTKVFNNWNLPENSRNSTRAHELAVLYSKQFCFQKKNGKVIWTGYIQKKQFHTINGELDAQETIVFGKPKR